MGRDDVVGRDSLRAGLCAERIPREGADFPNPSRPALGSTQPPVQWMPGHFPGLKRPGRGVDHPPPTTAGLK